MKLKRSDVLPVLQSAVKIASKRTTQPVLNCVLLESSNDLLRVSATDSQQRLVSLIQGGGGITPICVNAARLSESMRFAGEDIELSVSGDRIHCKSDLNSFSLAGLPAKEFSPKPQAMDMRQIGVNTEDLANAVETVLHCASDDENRQVLQSVYLDGDEKGLLAIGTDGKVCAMTSALTICAPFKCFIPTRYMDGLLSSLRQPKSEFHLSSDYVMVKHADGEFWGRLVEGEYPALAVQGVASKVTEELGEIDMPKLKFHLMASQVGCDDFTRNIDLDFSTEGLALKAHNANADYTASISGKFKEVKFRFDQHYLLQVLEKHKDKAKVYMQPFEPKNCLMFESGNIKSFALSMIRPTE